MPQSKLTPIERAIAGQPQDRRRRWDQRKAQAGFKRVSLWVPADRVPLLKELKSQLVQDYDFEALMDFVTCSYRHMLDDPECTPGDREFALKSLQRLGVAPTPSVAREDATPSAVQGSRP